jgi:outer membrane protein assembly factor BamB
MRRLLPVLFAFAPAVLLPAAPGPKASPGWSMFGGTPARNMVNPTARGLPDDWNIESGKNIRWAATLGSRSYSQPVVVGDRVLVGTNNENPRNNRDRGNPTDDNPEGPPLDKGILMCFRAADGSFVWQAVHDMLGSLVNDWPREGVCSTPVVEGERIYYVSNRCEVVCLDLNGFADGNQGFQGEQYKDKIDADVLWSFNMITELGVFPHNKAACSPLIVGELVFVVTGNGVDENHLNVAVPDAPSFLALNKHTGKLTWKSSLPGKNIMHAQWGNPAYGEFGGKPTVIFPGGDGWLYGLEPATGKLIWRFDANPKDSTYEMGGKGTRNDFVCAPVVYEGRIYIGTGQDPEHMEGVGHFWCIDPAGKTGDISPDLVSDAKAKPPKTRPNPNSAAVWHFGGEERRAGARRDYVLGRTMSTACIVDGVIYIPELAGYVHCLDAKTGRRYWVYDTKSNIWGSCYYADGKVYVANEDGDVFVFRHDPKPELLPSPDDAAVGATAGYLRSAPKELGEPTQKKAAREFAGAAAQRAQRRVADQVLIRKIEMEVAIRTTPTAVGDTLYIAAENKLFAIGKK